jgi:transposase
MRLLVVTLRHSNSRYCMAMHDEHAECFCAGFVSVFGWVGRVLSTLVLDNATEAGCMVHGKVTESTLFSQLRAHYRCASRYCNPYSGNEKGSVENAIGFLRRNLLVPVPSAGTVGQLNDLLRAGCDKINASSRNRQGRPTAEALARPRVFGESTIRREMPGDVAVADRVMEAGSRCSLTRSVLREWAGKGIPK